MEPPQFPQLQLRVVINYLQSLSTQALQAINRSTVELLPTGAKGGSHVFCASERNPCGRNPLRVNYLDGWRFPSQEDASSNGLAFSWRFYLAAITPCAKRQILRRLVESLSSFSPSKFEGLLRHHKLASSKRFSWSLGKHGTNSASALVSGQGA